MSNKNSPQETQRSIQQILEAETNDFMKLARIAGLDIATDFANADLSDVDLSGANLRGANLSETDLSRAKLIGANLSEADFTNAVVNLTIFGDNHGLTPEDKANLLARGAIFV